MKTIKALKIGKGTAVVSTRGLRRVVIYPGGEIVRELVSIHSAKVYADSFNIGASKFRAVVEKYPQK